MAGEVDKLGRKLTRKRLRHPGRQAVLHRFMGELKWSRAKLARKVGVSVNTASRWYSGANGIPLVLLLYLEQIVHAKKLYSP